MSVNSLPSLICGMVCAALGIWIYTHDRKNAKYRSFALLAFAIAIWCVHLFGLTVAPDELFAMSWTRIFAVGMFFLPACFLHFVLLLAKAGGARVRVFLGAAYGLGAFFTVLHWSGQFVTEFVQGKVMYLPRPTIAYWSYMLYFGVTVGSALVILAHRFRQEKSPAERKHLGSIILAVIVGAGVGSTNIVLALCGGGFYPVAYLGGLAFTGITGHALLKHGA